MIGLQVAPAGTEDPEKKPEVCHLTGGDPSFPLSPVWVCGRCFLSDCFLLNRGREGSEGLRIGRKGLIGLSAVRTSRCGLLHVWKSMKVPYNHRLRTC